MWFFFFLNSKERISSSTIELNEYNSLSQGWLRVQRSYRHQICRSNLVSDVHIKATQCIAEMQKNTSENYNRKSLSYLLINNLTLLLLFRCLKHCFFIFTLDFVFIWDFIGLQVNSLLVLVLQILICWIFKYIDLSLFFNSCSNCWGYRGNSIFIILSRKIRFNTKRGLSFILSDIFY